MKLVTVHTAAQVHDFITLPQYLYAKDENYIQPLAKDVLAVFDPAQNPHLKKGVFCRWVVYNSANKPVGRVAAFTGYGQQGKAGEPVGALGFFESINDIQVANLLFDACKKWLQGHGLEGMDGPVNFGERDRWWGLLIDGFLPPSYCMNYNPPYYQQLFENYGFKIWFKQYTFYRRITDPVPDKYKQRAEQLLSNPLYRFEHIQKRHLERYALQFMEVYNKAWGAIHPNFTPITPEQAIKLMNSMKPIIDEKIIYFGYYQNEPIGFFICLPEINSIVKLLHGQFTLWHRLKFWWYLKSGYCKRMFGLVFGVAPQHQQKGVESALVMAASKVLQSGFYTRYYDMELTWIGDFNPIMVNIARGLGGKLHKTHATYRCWFEEGKPVIHHEVITQPHLVKF